MKNENRATGKTVKNTITIANNVAFPSLRKGKAFKALLFVSSEIDRTLAPGSVHTVPISLFCDLLRFKLSNKDTALILEELENLKVDWSAYNPDYRGFSHVISSCRYDLKKDTISYSFDPMFIKEYLDSKTPFKNIPLSLIMDFRSNYALKIYELSFQYYDPKRKEGQTPAFSYAKLRSFFNLMEDQYKNSGHFFQKVIRNPLKEANEVSDFDITFHQNQKRGNLRRYWFEIKLNKQIRFNFSKDSQLINDENQRKHDEEERRITAKRFLDYWGEEFKLFANKKMTDAEREMWVDPLLRNPPGLNNFAEILLIDKFSNVSLEKKEAYQKKCEDLLGEEKLTIIEDNYSA